MYMYAKGIERIEEKTYRGENQEQYISAEDTTNILNLHGWGGPPSVLKGFFFGDPFNQERGHGFLLGYLKTI